MRVGRVEESAFSNLSARLEVNSATGGINVNKGFAGIEKELVGARE